GVDINENSVEICRLRLWIELLKNSYYLQDGDEGFDANLSTQIHQMQTLPNIDINIKCGNSLVSYFELKHSLSHYPNIKARINKYKIAVLDYKEGFFEDKTHIQKEIKALKEGFRTFCFADKFKKEVKAFEKKCEAYSKKYGNFLAKDDENLSLYIAQGFGFFEFDENEARAEFKALKKDYEGIFKLESNKPFEWRFEFPELLDEKGDFMGFDLIIGNPPYIKEMDNKKLFEFTKNLRTYQGKMDIWYHFVGRGFDLLKNQGILTFIATNNWTTNAGAKNLRNVILQESQILNLVDFGSYMAFDSASIQTMVMEFSKTKPPKSYTINYAKIENKNPTCEHREALLQNKPFEDNLYLTPTITPKISLNNALTFANSKQDELLNKIIKNGEFRLKADEMTNGIHPHYDFINKKINFEHNNKFTDGEGIFGLSTLEKESLNLSNAENKLVKPYFDSKKFTKYYANPKNTLWLIYTDSKFKNPNSMNEYPNIKNHLDKFKNVITSDNKPYGLHRARNEIFFTGQPRIVALRKCVNAPLFSYVDFDCYVSAAFYIIKTERLNSKYLIGILNSKLIAFWLKHKGKMQGNNYQIDKEPLLKLPIPKINSKNSKIADKIVNLVEQILALKNPCHTERSEVSQENRDISAFAKPQYDKDTNPQADLFNLPNTKNTKKSKQSKGIDYHEPSSSHNDNTSKLEQEIDTLVYALYNLNESEIQLIEKGI
ncbi:Eco57I restriction-modification methylase domain-containing protein, partial [Campylobacter troglodytis]|uniref:Eco57I restriction-modification methylase domain-containing protein n=1 Tax=Campylobacter troglodytis TaxID=654363 RepID=UPI00163C2877